MVGNKCFLVLCVTAAVALSSSSAQRLRGSTNDHSFQATMDPGSMYLHELSHETWDGPTRSLLKAQNFNDKGVLVASGGSAEAKARRGKAALGTKSRATSENGRQSTKTNSHATIKRGKGARVNTAAKGKTVGLKNGARAQGGSQAGGRGKGYLSSGANVKIDETKKGADLKTSGRFQNRGQAQGHSNSSGSVKSKGGQHGQGVSGGRLNGRGGLKTSVKIKSNTPRNMKDGESKSIVIESKDKAGRKKGKIVCKDGAVKSWSVGLLKGVGSLTIKCKADDSSVHKQ